MRRLSLAAAAVLGGCEMQMMFDDTTPSPSAEGTASAMGGGTATTPGGGVTVTPTRHGNTGSTSGTGSGAGAQSLQPGNAPRPIAPLSTSTVSTQQPTLRWLLAPGSDGAHVQVCRDRACATSVEQTIDAVGTSATPPVALAAGVHFWRLSPTGAGAVRAAWSPTWEFFVGHRSAPVYTAEGTMADFNGDGFADVAVGSPDLGLGGATTPSAVNVFLGGSSGSSTVASTLLGPDGSHGFGYSVSSAGDVNGDGYADLAVGEYPAGSSTTGNACAAWVYLGGPSGLSASAIILNGSAGGSCDASSVSSADDLNGDGFADVLVVRTITSAGTGRPSADVYYGGSLGPSGVPTPVGVPDGNTLGWAASVGDINADGYGDLLVSAVDPTVSAGPIDTTYVYLGGADGIAGASAVLTRPTDGNGFGNTVASAGDVNGDGYGDAIVGSDVSGAAYVYLGGATGLTTAPSPLVPGAGSMSFGYAVASAGDVNGDGYGDVVVGEFGLAEQGAAYVFLGGPDGANTSPITVQGPSEAQYFGARVSGAGDVNGDGYSDLLMGASPSVFVCLGGGEGPVTAPATLTGSMGSTWFGTAVARVLRVFGDCAVPGGHSTCAVVAMRVRSERSIGVPSGG